MKKIDVLNLEWPANQRDAYVIAPIVSALRHHGFNCVTGDIFDYINYLKKYRPKILLMTSFQGAKINDRVCRVAKTLGIKVITLIAEGNIREEVVDYCTWGNNSDQNTYFEKMLVWSEKSKDIITRNFPKLSDRVESVGAVGFDRYKYINFLDKEEFLKQTNLNYQHIVGIAGWGFNVVHDTEYFRKYELDILKNMWPGQLSLHQRDFKKLSKLYHQIISENPNILFILRPHPSILDHRFNEFNESRELKNVYYADAKSSRFGISDLINVCDLWGGYETTTCLEAWLLNKPTFLINPSGRNFNRDSVSEGSYIFEDEIEFISSFNNYEEIIRKVTSKQIIEKREKIVKDTIGYSDGNNFLRATNEIVSVLMSTNYSTYKNRDVSNHLTNSQKLKHHILRSNVIRWVLGLRLIDHHQVEKVVEEFEAYPEFLDRVSKRNIPNSI